MEDWMEDPEDDKTDYQHNTADDLSKFFNEGLKEGLLRAHEDNIKRIAVDTAAHNFAKSTTRSVFQMSFYSLVRAEMPYGEDETVIQAAKEMAEIYISAWQKSVLMRLEKLAERTLGPQSPQEDRDIFVKALEKSVLARGRDYKADLTDDWSMLRHFLTAARSRKSESDDGEAWKN